jgi:hypothetical protein
MIYRVAPEELQNKGSFAMASKAASSLVHASFDDDFAAAAGFVKWTWERQKSRHNWSLQQGREPNRLGWRLQFSPSLVTDWRVATSKRRRV